jgi:hypothetical protein
MGGHVALTELMRNTYKILVGKPEGKRTCGRPSLKCEDDIKKDMKEI